MVGGYFFSAVRQWGHSENLRNEILRIVRTKGEVEANFQDQTGNTALIWAAERGRKDLCAVLIGLGADVNLKDKNGRSPLSYSSQKGHYDTTGFLIQNGARPNLADNEGKTPLMWACIGGHPGVVELLVKNNADSGIADKSGKTPLNLIQDMIKRYDQLSKALSK